MAQEEDTKKPSTSKMPLIEKTRSIFRVKHNREEQSRYYFIQFVSLNNVSDIIVCV
jgi:hypothetical protein